MRVSRTRGILAGLALVLAGSGSAMAADAQAFGNRVKEVTAETSFPLNFASAESSGDNVVLKGVTAGTGDGAAKLGDVTFETVTGSDAEGWKVARIPFADINTTENGRQIVANGMAVEGLQIAGKTGPSKLPGEAPYYFDSAAVNGLKVSEGGKDALTLGATSLTNAVDTDGKIATEATLGDFTIALPQDDEAAKTLRDIGYESFTGTGSMEMNWDPKTGALAVEPLQFTVENVGAVDLAYSIGGYTPAFARSLATIQKQMAADPQAAQSSGMAIIGLMSQLNIGNLQLSFTDASLTGKLLDYYAKKNNQSRDQLISALSQLVPQSLASLNNPAFQAQVTSAVDAFLKDPQSLTVSIDPAQAIPATQILGAVMGAPQTLPNVLQLRVTANDQTTDEPDEAQDGDAGTATDVPAAQ
ncbi:hypothetical protein [Aureimonas psammosilenae]|uniref:hypothetical protein n=1 Tax=Aureimonas psammosilenae TaxID=2495496 RepID=UPI001260EE3D|nr:hypothetical protein [Aureimonas psammosilenae]